jgi:hypothetical protein
MCRTDEPRLKNPSAPGEPIWMRLRPAFPAGCFRAAGFVPEDLPSRDWSALWDRWLSVARVGLVPLPPRTLLLAELPASVEEETDAHFPAFPLLGYAHTVLAQTLCRDLMAAVLGETFVCLPFPCLSAQERAVLIRLDILSSGRSFPALLRRYALLTLCPPAEGCRVCALAVACPGQSER